MNNYKAILILILLVVSASANAMTGKEYLQRVNANYNSLKSFEIIMGYKLYKGHQGNDLRDEYQSRLSMAGRKSHRKLYAEEVITTENKSLILNHDLKTIQVLPGVKANLFDQDIPTLLRQCDALKVTETENGKLLTITFKKYSSVQYSKINVLINSKFWVTKMTLFYATQMNYSRDHFHPDMDYPRLEVEYGKIKKGWKDNEGLTNLSNYIIEKNGIHVATEQYKHYEIIQ